MGHRVYCAGPLFNQAERDEMEAIAGRVCAAGMAVYLPHRDGMEFRHVHHHLVEAGWGMAIAAKFLHQAIFSLDVFQLVEACDSVVWNLNGRVPDEGAVSEAAIAWTLGKPLVGYKDDVRSLITGRDNPLLVGLVEFETVSNLDAIVPALRAALAACREPVIGLDQLNARVRRGVERGRELWSVMQSAGASTENNGMIARVVESLFAPAGTGTPTSAHEREPEVRQRAASDGRAGHEGRARDGAASGVRKG